MTGTTIQKPRRVGIRRDADKKTRLTAGHPLLETHPDMALVDVYDLMALVSVSRSWILAEVSAGRAPAPVIRRPRCTRWKLSDWRVWLNNRAAQATSDDEAKKAGVAAKAAASSPAAAHAPLIVSK